LLINNNAKKAKTVLKEIKNYQPEPLYYQLLAKAEEALGNEGASHRLLAEYYLMYYQIGIAIDHLQQALSKNDISSIDSKNINQRIQEIRTMAQLAEKF